MHVILRQLPTAPDAAPSKVRVELSVVDTGKVRRHTFIIFAC